MTSLLCGYAVRDEALTRNPVPDVQRLPTAEKDTSALTAPQVNRSGTCSSSGSSASRSSIVGRIVGKILWATVVPLGTASAFVHWCDSSWKARSDSARVAGSLRSPGAACGRAVTR